MPRIPLPYRCALRRSAYHPPTPLKGSLSIERTQDASQIVITDFQRGIIRATKADRAPLQVEVQQKSKAVIVQLLDQAAVNDQALLEALAQLKSPGNLVRRDLAPE